MKNNGNESKNTIKRVGKIVGSVFALFIAFVIIATFVNEYLESGGKSIPVIVGIIVSLLIWLGMSAYNAWLAYSVSKFAPLYWVLSMILFPPGTIIILLYLLSKKRKKQNELYEKTENL